VKFSEHKKLQEDCSDIRKCVERMITQRDLASAISPMFASYVAREMGTVDVGKVVSSVDTNFLTAGSTVIFKKGNLLLDRFNILMRSYMEDGLLETLWREIQHRAFLKCGSRFGETSGQMFFAFSVSQLTPGFVVLLVGTILGSLLLIAELILNGLSKHKKKYSRFGSGRKLCY